MSNNYNKPFILIVDDEEAILKSLKDGLTDESYRVETISKGENALDTIGKLIPDIVLLDIFMPNCNGLKLLEKIKKEYPNQKVIIISGFGTVPIAVEAIKNGATDFIEKPLNLDEIINKIESLICCEKKQYNSPEIQNKNISQQCDIVGESNLFLELINQVNILARHRIPILLYGEPGVGKSSLAKYIHYLNNGSHKDFLEINCETITENFEKIFLKEKTLYLKNIDALPEKLQRSLLSILKNNNALPHIIVSSRSCLFRLTKQQKFSSSLFFHLNKAPIEIPPLRKRSHDIPLLINFFLEQYNSKYGGNIDLTQKAIRILCAKTWPGNITELKNTIQKIVMLGTHKTLNEFDMATIIGEKETQILDRQSFKMFGSLDEARNEFEKNFIKYVLEKNHYNLSQVSNRLNLSEAQLQNKISELNIHIP